MMGKYASMMKAVHILLRVSIKSTAVVEEQPCTSLDELILDFLASVMQDLRWWDNSRVSRQPVLVLVLVSSSVLNLAQPK
jgi:hypothetical protein